MKNTPKQISIIFVVSLVYLLTSCASTPYHTKGRYRTPVSPKKSCGCMINPRLQSENTFYAIQVPASLYDQSVN